MILRHFYVRRKEVLLQCAQWKKELMDGIRKLRSQGTNVSVVIDYLKNLVKKIELLTTTLGKIDLSQFNDGGGEQTVGV